jgi:hypothetical protein
MDVLSLLRSKNRCLEKFLEASTEFLADAERSDALPDLPSFELRRDAILKAIELYDRKINEAVSLLPPGQKPLPLVEAVKVALDSKEALIRRILLVDERILERVEAEKTKVLKEIVSTHKQANLVQKFKSTWMPDSGEEIDKKL